jgi:nucleotide-binding universal stress UspA family protein
MYHHILIPTDGSELSQRAAAHGIALAKSIGAKVTIMTVSTPYHLFANEHGKLFDTRERYEQRAALHAENCLNAAKDAASAAGVNCAAMHLVHEHPYQAIIDVAARSICDLIVMASHGRRGVSAVVLGSETVKVLTHSAVPVLVFRSPHPSAYVAAS